MATNTSNAPAATKLPRAGRIIVAVVATLLIVSIALVGVRGAQLWGEWEAQQRWLAVLEILTTEARILTTVYHNPDHDSARVASLHERVTTARTRMDSAVHELRAEIARSPKNAAVAARQQAVLDRILALSALTEEVRRNIISGDLEFRRGIRISNAALFAEVNWVQAEMAATASVFSARFGPDSRLALLTFEGRSLAAQSLMRRDILLENSNNVEMGRQELLSIAREMLAYAPVVRAEAERDSIFALLDSSTVREERRRRYAQLANNMEQFAGALQRHADALAAANPDNVDDFEQLSLFEALLPEAAPADQ